jgi:hypothetical protein
VRHALEQGHEVEMQLGMSRGEKHFHLSIHVWIEAANATQHSHVGHQH